MPILKRFTRTHYLLIILLFTIALTVIAYYPFYKNKLLNIWPSVLGIATQKDSHPLETAVTNETPLSKLQQRIPTIVPTTYLLHDKEKIAVPSEKLSKCFSSQNENLIPLQNSNQPSIECSSPQHPNYDITINTECIEQYLRKHPLETKTYYTRDHPAKIKVRLFLEDYIIHYDKLAEQITRAYQKELDTCQLSQTPYVVRDIFVKVKKDELAPNTDGQVASQYVEIDGTCQLLFYWQDGKVEKIFRISGAFLKHNPVGVYRIQNKNKKRWSSTAQKWMPYWMGFVYSHKQEAWFGIHALVYWYEGYHKTGTKKIYEPASNIGQPKSTGCIRLLKKDTKYLYNRLEKGDIVVIHN